MKPRHLLGGLLILALILTLAHPPANAQLEQGTVAQTGTITANGGSVGVGQGFSTPPLNGQNCSADISGTWTGTLTFELAQQSNNFYVANTYVTANPSTTTGNELVAITTAGATSFEVLATAAWTGTANVTIYCTASSAINTNGGSGGGGSTPIPYPTSSAGVLEVACANPPTFQGTCPTPQPTQAPTPIPTGTGYPPPATMPYGQNVQSCLYTSATPSPTSGNLITCPADSHGSPIVEIEPGSVVVLGGTCYVCLTPQNNFILTSASTQTCTAISTTAGLLNSVQNSNAAAQTATITFFQDNGTCAAGDNVYAITLGIQQVVTFGLGLYSSAGWSYTLSAAAANDISVGYSH